MKKNYYIILLIIIVIAIAVRVLGINIESLWFDEIYSIALAKKTVLDIISITAGDVHPPFYYMILSFWINLFGDSAFSTRLLSTLFSILSIPVLFLIAKKMFNVRVGMIASLLFAISRINIYYSQEVRMYSLFTFFVLLSFYYFIIISIEKKDKIIYLLLFTLINTFLLYIHNFAFLIFFVQLMYCLIDVIRKKNILSISNVKLFFSYLLTFVLYLPWFFILIEQIRKVSRGFWLPSISMLSPFEALIELSGGIFLCIIFVILLIIDCIKESKIEKNEKLVHSFEPKNLLYLWLILPILTPFIMSFILNPIFNARYLLFTSPALILLIALSIDNLKENYHKVFLAFIILVLAFLAIFNDINIDEKENWRGTAKSIQKQIKANDLLIIENNFEFEKLGGSKVLIDEYLHSSSIKYLQWQNKYSTGEMKILINQLKKYKNIYCIYSHNKQNIEYYNNILLQADKRKQQMTNYSNYARRYLYFEKYGNKHYDIYLFKIAPSDNITIIKYK